MMGNVKWGIISTAKIGINNVIPALQQANNCEVAAISSRSADKAQKAASKLNIPRSYGSYEELLSDDEVDAVYNPLPNHLHVPLSIKAMEAGKHVLCEKPVAMTADEAGKLLEASHEHPDLKVMEAFMYRFHPQWIKAKAMVDNGDIGKLQTINSFFSFYNDDPDDIRNRPEMGGGGMMDIGCYCISLSRFLFDREPSKAIGEWKIDPKFDVDYLASGILDFGTGTATFSCATQTEACQEVNIVGTTGRITMEVPFNPPPDERTRIWLYQNGRKEEFTFEPVNQYTLQAEEFAQAVIENRDVPTPLEDALNNMKVIDAFKKSARKN